MLAVALTVGACLLGQADAAVKGVFAHYLVGGMANYSDALTDVQQAQAMSFDAFALNVQQPEAGFTNTTLAWLFQAAEAQGFKLFFSMDMTWITSPSAFIPLFEQWCGNSAYYQYGNRPFLSTFDGGADTFGASSANEGWTTQMRDVLSAAGVDVFFVPDFDDWGGSSYTAAFFDEYTVVDGVMAWETAWPAASAGMVNVSDEIDAASLSAAGAAGKLYMMPVSSFQSKHLSSTENWYRVGEMTLPLRIQQALALQPDFVEVVTWNDGGEGHYIASVWPESVTGTDIPLEINGYDHSGWQAVLAPFVVALKNGVADISELYPFGEFAGVFWYRPLLKNADCSGDRFGLGQPSNWESAQDIINLAVLLPAGSSGVTIQVTSGGTIAASFAGVPGLNMHEVPFINLGAQEVQLINPNGTIMGAGSSTIDVTDSISDLNDICNFNYAVVHIA